MPSAPATPRSACPLRARLAALVCLLAWFVGTSALLPAAVAALGSLDGQHRVSLATERGRVAVVFHHPNAGQAPQHQHSPLAGMLTACAQARGPAQDHVLAFTQTDEARLAAPIAQPAASLAGLPSLAESYVLLSVPQFSDVCALAPRPPPTCAFALVCLRSTTLLV